MPLFIKINSISRLIVESNSISMAAVQYKIFRASKASSALLVGNSPHDVFTPLICFWSFFMNPFEIMSFSAFDDIGLNESKSPIDSSNVSLLIPFTLVYFHLSFLRVGKSEVSRIASAFSRASLEIGRREGLNFSLRISNLDRVSTPSIFNQLEFLL